MCGIFCSYKCKAPGNKRLLNRGPDRQCSSSLNDVVLNAYILYVQGACKQPCSRDGCHLIYNGQIFQYPQVCILYIDSKILTIIKVFIYN